MERFQQSLLLLLWTVAALNTCRSNAAVVEDNKLQERTLTDSQLEVIPNCDNNSSVTKLLIDGGRITLNEADKLALASCSVLVEFRLKRNKVTSIPAKYFSVVPHLSVLSLSGNNISSLDPECLSGLEVLTELDLSNNLLTSLHPQLFTGLDDLQVLNLQGNPWNCSCPLLSTIKDIKAAGASIGHTGGVKALCASPEKQAGRDLLEATAACYPSLTTTFTTDLPKPPTAVSVKKSWASSTILKTTANKRNNVNKGPTPVSGNTWKFTACVAALAVCTCVVIVCAIKGPSWYKLFHNYRHRRLHYTEEEEEEDGDVVPTVFSKTGRYFNGQTFSFEQENSQIEEIEEEEEEDGYFEDPYVKREDCH